MSATHIIVAANFKDRLVMLEDGRELPIAAFYASPGPGRLTTNDTLTPDMEVDDPEIAEVFTVSFPGTDAVLIVGMGDISYAGKPN